MNYVACSREQVFVEKPGEDQQEPMDTADPRVIDLIKTTGTPDR